MKENRKETEIMEGAVGEASRRRRGRITELVEEDLNSASLNVDGKIFDLWVELPDLFYEAAPIAGSVEQAA